MTSTPRVYGMADEDNRQAPALEGFRGERGATVDDPKLRHNLNTGADGISVQESSGAAFVEATGAPGPVTTQDGVAEKAPDSAPDRSSSRP
ncbi:MULTISPECIES: hypothetical protein [Bacteria]|uniref:hypothetical protein n=1 Tax=Bacteria TaxID=2 RepID=UPI001401EDA0|nr:MULTISPECIES: hypothetical protein [Bacteria]